MCRHTLYGVFRKLSICNNTGFPPRQIALLYAAVGDFDSTVFEIPSAVETNDIFVTDTLCQSRQSLLLYPVVAIDKPYVPTTSSPKPRITCTTEPSILLSYYLYLVIFTRILVASNCVRLCATNYAGLSGI